MMDWNTYLITKDTLNSPVIHQNDPHITYGIDDTDWGEIPTGILIGRAISLALIVGAVLYFYITW